MSVCGRRVSGLLGLAVLSTAIAVPAQRLAFEQRLEEAKVLYRQGSFQEAISKLQDVVTELKPLREVEVRKAQLADAYLHLGLSHLGIGQREEGKEALKAMLRLDPQRRLDPDIYAPKVIGLVEEARAEVREQPTTPAGPQRAPERLQAEPKKASRLPWILLGAAGAAGGGVALTRGGNKASSAPPDFSLQCEPSALSITQSGVRSTCTTTASNGFNGTVALSCSGQPGGVPCRFDPTSLNVTPNASFSSTLVVDLALMAQPGSYTFQAVAGSGALTRTAALSLSIAATCAGFREQASYTGSCLSRPANSICWGFSDGYVWLVENEGFGAAFLNLGPCEGRIVQVARGGRADYHHVLGTLLVKVGPSTR